MKNAPPLFVIGSPRSGTTLLRLMLTCHPHIHIPPECGFAVWLAPRYAGWSPARTPERLEAFLDDLAAARKFDTWRLDPDRIRAAVRRAPPDTYAGLVDLIYRLHAGQAGKPDARWGDKNNFYLHHIADIHRLFPDAVFIHIVRDPRDIFCSYREINAKRMTTRFAPNLPDTPEAAAAEWTANIRSIREAFSRLPPSRVHTIRFDRLVMHPEASLRTLCAFLREPYDPAMLAYPDENREKRLEPAEFLAWKEKTLEPPRQDRCERYRRELSRAEIASIERIAGEAMHAYGFPA